MKQYIFFILTAVMLVSTAEAQSYFIRGKISDAASGEPLLFANVRASGTTLGTSATKKGEFELKLPEGRHTLIVSYIGYLSDTVVINLNRNMDNIDFNLEPTNLMLPEVTVLPGENPAVPIIRRAIKRKEERNSQISNYDFTAYTKGVVWTDTDMEGSGSSLNIGVSDEDSSELQINGIIENESRGYFLSPDNYKEIITARKQTANLPSTMNILTGGRIIQNFYSEYINFMGKELPGPVSDDALDYYYFHLVKTAAIDNRIVYHIYMTPDYESNPGFMGDIYIIDSTYDLIKVDLHLNRAANIGGLFDTINVYQQFNSYNGIYMPADYRLYVHANVLGLAEIILDLNSVLYDYNINTDLNDDFFDEVIIKVLPDADDKDSSYWAQTQTLPASADEITAYEKIDSISSAPKDFWDEFSFLSSRISFTDELSTSAPLAMYHFNRVEGHSIDFGVFVDDAVKRRLNTAFMMNYGFADKRFKAALSGSYLLGNYRTTKLSFNFYKKLNTLFAGSDNYNDLFSSVLALFSKYEFNDYYYSTGFDINLEFDFLPIIRLNGGFINHTDRSAYKNTDFSLFRKKEKYKPNMPVTETTVRAVTAGFKLDFRKFIEDGMFRRRVGMSDSYIQLNGQVTYAGSAALNNQIGFTQYEANLSGRVNSIGSTSLGYRIFGLYTNGRLPFQMLFSLPGNIDLTSMGYTFRTLEVNEALADRAVTVNLDYSWGDNIFRWLRVPMLKDLELQLNTFINAAYTGLNSGSRSLMPVQTVTFNKPFFEAGFGIGHVLFPMTFDFSWKLNHRGYNNFRFGINTFIIL